MEGIRFTKEVVEKLLKANEGKEFETKFIGNNIRDFRTYTISDGKMFVKSSGKTSWSDSHFNHNDECDLDTARRILKKFIDKIDLSTLSK